MISMLYWEELTSSARMVKVAVLSEAGTPARTSVSMELYVEMRDVLRRMMPESGVTAEPCCSLIVTVLLEGSVHVMVKGWPAMT
jgi:hypothetical protein